MRIYNLGNRVVNCYLVSIDSGYMLVDTGYAENYRVFRKRLQQCGVSPEEIKYIFLTHAHDDHAGFLNQVLAITSAQVILHPKAIERLQAGQNSFEGGCSGRLAWLFCRILALCGKGEHRFPPIKKEYLNRLITTDSEMFRKLALPIEVIETPGHTADHIAMLRDGILFCGDAAMNGFPSTRRVIIWIENVEQYRRSWAKMIDANATVIYPAHGKPFSPNDLKKYQPDLDRIQLYPIV